jgi:hypothetical protein
MKLTFNLIFEMNKIFYLLRITFTHYQVVGLDVTQDNSQFVSCGGDRYAILWDVTAATSIRHFRGFDNFIFV